MTLYENEKTLQSVTHGFDDLAIRNDKYGLHTQQYDYPDQPPPYEANHATSVSYQRQPYSISTQYQTTGPSRTTALPCVIPQISKPFGSAFGSPFTRAYPPSLASRNITQSDFLAFLDGLNEVFISHPILQGLSAAGGIMSMFHGTPIIQSVGMGIQLTSDLSSAAASYARTRAYIKACNADLFHPTGLQATIMSTKDMMARIGHPEERLRLPPLDTVEDLDRYTNSPPSEDPGVKAEHRSQQPMNDPRVRRINALQGYVAPLNFDVPAVVAPDNLLNKMSAWQAQRVTASHEKKEAKRLAKSHSRQEGDSRPVMREQDERKLERKLAKIEREMDKKDGKRKDREVRKAQEEYEREQRKIDKKLDRKGERHGGKGKGKEEDKEEKQANKVRWLVITEWRGEEEETSDDGSLDSGRY